VTIYPWLQQDHQALAQRAKNRQLHHALLLLARHGTGKTDFAQHMAQYLLCQNSSGPSACGQCKACLLFKAGSHPDLHQIESEKQIGVDQIRQGLAKLSATSQLSGAKVLLIHAADTMTEASANALLKTLEEPTANTFLLLTAESTQGLLPTVLSRCEKVRLTGATKQQTLDWLQTQNIDIPPQLLDLYGDRPLLAKSKSQQTDDKDFIAFQQQVNGLVGLDPVQLANEWQAQSIEVVSWLQYWLKQEYQQPLAGLQWQLYQNCLQAKQAMLNPGVNKSLLLTQLFIQTQQLLAKPV